MALLHGAGCTYLSLGYESLSKPGEVNGIPLPLRDLTMLIHSSVVKELPLSGKKQYHDKWCPDDEQRSGLHLVFPGETPGPQEMYAVLKLCNVSARSVVAENLRDLVHSGKAKGSKDT
jgi:hypothetical protein